MKVAAALAAVVATATTAHANPATPQPADYGATATAPRLARHIAPLFKLGNAWTFDTSLTRWGDQLPNGKMTKATEHDEVTCLVDAVHFHAAARAIASHVSCTKDIYKLRLEGWYVATAAGLWTASTFDAPTDDDIAEIVKQPAMIAAAPHVERKTIRVDGPDPVHNRIVIDVRAISGGWCVEAETSDADPDGGFDSRCFVAGMGPASGQDTTGGELNDFRYSLQRPKH